MTYGSSSASGPKNICELMTSHFKSVYAPQFSTPPSSTPLSHPTLLPLSSEVSPCDILKILNQLDISKGAGPDGIPPLFFKSTADLICVPLSILFQKSLDSGTFPIEWKKSFIVPIHKSGSRTDVTNYRGISILSCISKIFEQTVLLLISDSLVATLDPRQHAYMEGKSTVTNLTSYVSQIIDYIHKGHTVDAIYTDFSKAFDRLCHFKLIEKLRSKGVDTQYLDWFSSYLSNRTSRVRLEDHFSSPISATSGVPQGSHLGPLLFLVYIDDLVRSLKDVSCSVYADDFKIFRHIGNDSDHTALQNAITAVDDWCSSNNMELNVKKCQVITFRRKEAHHHSYKIGNVVLDRVSSMKDLGVVLDESLSFDRHIDYTVGRCRSLLGMIKRFAKEFNDPYITKLLYISLVRSVIEYAAPVWSPHSVDGDRMGHRDKIESIQKQFLLFALRGLGWRNSLVLPSYRSRLMLLNMQTLRERHLISCSLLIFDCLKRNIRCPYMLNQLKVRNNTFNLRRPRYLETGSYRTSYGLGQPMNKCIRIFNKLSHLYLPSLTKGRFRVVIQDAVKTM